MKHKRPHIEEMKRNHPYQIVVSIVDLGKVDGVPNPGAFHEAIGGVSWPYDGPMSVLRVFAFATMCEAMRFIDMLRMLDLEYDAIGFSK